MLLNIPTSETQQEVADKARIKELVEFERFCRDNALWDEMKKCYAEDSRVEISWFQGTGWEFVEQSSRMKNRASHKIYNTAIWLKGDRAVAIMVTTIGSRRTIGGAPMDLHSDAKTIFRVKRIEGRWRILSLGCIYEQDSLVPVLPGNGVLPSDALQGYRESYACLSYVLAQDGYAIDENLAGVDRPELVEAFYREADNWLCSKE